MTKFTKLERQYIKGIVHNLSLQRLTDQDIVDYLHSEKKIDISRSTVTKIKNQVEEEVQIWFKELQDSSHKTIAFYKERLDSLLSYQKRLNKIIEFYMQDGQIIYSDTIVRAIAELHKIEMSLHSIFREFPHHQYPIESENREARGINGGICDCLLTQLLIQSAGAVHRSGVLVLSSKIGVLILIAGWESKAQKVNPMMHNLIGLSVQSVKCGL